MKQIFFVLLSILGIASTAYTHLRAQESTTPENIFIFRDESSLTIVLELDWSVSLDELFLVNGNDVPRPFAELSGDSGYVSSPTCIRQVVQNVDIRTPSKCAAVPPRDRRVVEIDASDTFWVEDDIKEYDSLYLYFGNTSIGECYADQVEDEACELPLERPQLGIDLTLTVVDRALLLIVHSQGAVNLNPLEFIGIDEGMPQQRLSIQTLLGGIDLSSIRTPLCFWFRFGADTSDPRVPVDFSEECNSTSYISLRTISIPEDIGDEVFNYHPENRYSQQFALVYGASPQQIIRAEPNIRLRFSR